MRRAVGLNKKKKRVWTHGRASTAFCFSKSTYTGRKGSGRRSDIWDGSHAGKGGAACLRITCPLQAIYCKLQQYQSIPSQRSSLCAFLCCCVEAPNEQAEHQETNVKLKKKNKIKIEYTLIKIHSEALMQPPVPLS